MICPCLPRSDGERGSTRISEALALALGPLPSLLPKSGRPSRDGLRDVLLSFTPLQVHQGSDRNFGASADGPPAGWIAMDGLLQPDPTVAGYLARMQEVRGICGQRDCKRRCEVDLQRLAARGFGALPVSTVQQFLRCQNLTGCGLDFHDDRRGGLPMRALFGRAHVKIRIKCAGCGFFRAATPESVWRRISTKEAPQEGLLVTEIAGKIKGACRQCGKVNWRVDVLWPDVNSEGWKRSAVAHAKSSTGGLN